MSSEDPWRERLSAEQYRICRQGGTEPPFTGGYVHPEWTGTFRCACCGAVLFPSSTQFDSGSGWPSFWAPARADAVRTHTDDSLGMRRVEVLCSGCRAHLGHVFADGPAPTGQRYCINSACLELEEAPEPPPAPEDWDQAPEGLE